MEQLGFLLVGVILILLGRTNMKGDISTIHWYNRTRVREKDVPKYGRLMGLGCVVMGAALLIAGVLQFAAPAELVAGVILIGVAAGLSLMLYAQFRYNRGLF